MLQRSYGEKIYKGGIFTCKTCGVSHIIPWDCIPFDRRKCINVSCFFAPNIFQKYRGYEFKDWQGTYKVYTGCLVKPSSK